MDNAPCSYPTSKMTRYRRSLHKKYLAQRIGYCAPGRSRSNKAQVLKEGRARYWLTNGLKQLRKGENIMSVIILLVIVAWMLGGCFTVAPKRY